MRPKSYHTSEPKGSLGYAIHVIVKPDARKHNPYSNIEDTN